MPIVLPASPIPVSAAERPIDYGSWQTPIAGGVITRLDRLGNRTAVDFVTPNLQPNDARIWCSRLRQGVGLVVRAVFPQLWLDPAHAGDVGAVVVNGSGQGGMALAVRGGASGKTISEGRAFNVFDTAGNAYLHFVTADTVIVNGSATIPLTPMLRTAPVDGSTVNLAAPVIDGMLTTTNGGSSAGWTQVRAFLQGLQFTVSEIR